MEKKSDKAVSAKGKAPKAKVEKEAKPSTAAAPKVVKTPSTKPASAPKKVEEPKEKSKTTPQGVGPSFEEIQLEAYHIAEKRLAKGIEGTAAGDWLQAEKTLAARKR